MPEIDLRKVKVAVIQLDCKLNNYDRNIKNAMNFLDKGIELGNLLFCLPEAFTTSINLAEIENIVETIPGKTTDVLCEKAAKHNIFISAGIFEKDSESRYYSTTVLINNDGNIIAKYRRIHAVELERKFISLGNEVIVVDTKIGRIGFLMGYDIYFPEICRQMCRQNVDIIICSVLLPAEYAYITGTVAKTRAIENNCYVVYCSGVGNNNYVSLEYMGNSMIVGSPTIIEKEKFDFMEGDEVLAKAERMAVMLSASLNIDFLHKENKHNILRDDMRSDLFF